jgi:hypothetical protein
MNKKKLKQIEYKISKAIEDRLEEGYLVTRGLISDDFPYSLGYSECLCVVGAIGKTTTKNDGTVLAAVNKAGLTPKQMKAVEGGFEGWCKDIAPNNDIDNYEDLYEIGERMYEKYVNSFETMDTIDSNSQKGAYW